MCPRPGCEAPQRTKNNTFRVLAFVAMPGAPNVAFMFRFTSHLFRPGSCTESLGKVFGMFALADPTGPSSGRADPSEPDLRCPKAANGTKTQEI